MPIEIKELNIRIHVNQNQQEQDSNSPEPEAHGVADKDELIAECVEQVMELLKNKQDR